MDKSYEGLLAIASSMCLFFDYPDFAMKTCEQLDPDLLGVLGLHGYDAKWHSGLDSLHAKDVLKYSSESSHQEQLTKGKIIDSKVE